MPRSVLHVSETTDGGVGRVLLDLASAQAAAGWRVSLLAPFDDVLSQVCAASGGQLRTWDPGPRPGPGLRAALADVRAGVGAADPDLVHLHSSMAGLCGRLVVRRRRPTLLQPHSWSFYARGGPARRAALAWERLAARWTDIVLCVSEDEARAAVRHRVRARCVVVPNGVDLARFPRADDDARAAARGRLGVPTGPLVVCVGRLHRQKGQHLLLDAWPMVLAQVPDARLALVGEGPDRAALQARQPPRTTFTGSTPAVADWLAAADVVVQPSVWEGMALSVLEALATGRSVVATDVAGMREVLGGGAGALVPREPAALVRALVERLADPDLAAREGRCGRALVDQHHSLHTQLAGVLRLYDELVPA